MDDIERFRGALLGLAAGDALGATLEFQAPGAFKPIQDMVGGGPFDLRAGEWTDDTSMALCLAASLVETGQFDPRDQIERYVRWWRDGYMSSNGVCFDIGGTTRAALAHFERTGEPYSGSPDPRSAGNGSLMRLAPAPLFFAYEPALAIERAGDSSRTTHAAPTAVDACRYFGGLVVGAVRSAPKETLLLDAYSPLGDYWETHPLNREVAEVARGSFKTKQPPAIRGTGYVVRSLEAALWAFYHTDTFRGGALKVVNLGDDADTTGAIFGQLAGAYYGERGIPAEWRERLAHRELIRELADGLYRHALREGPLG